MAENKVLIIEDDYSVVEVAKLYFENEGFSVSHAHDGQLGLEMVRKHSYDIVVLDVMLPVMDGFSVCREIRKFSAVPVIMLTARGDEFDRVLGLEIGADDYIAKPFSPRELMARVKAILRRMKKDISVDTEKNLDFPGLIINYNRREVLVENKSIQTSPKEFDLLWFLASNKGQVFSREQIFDNVWGMDFYGGLRTVDVHVKWLREKLEKDNDYKYIATVWGVGYKFEVKQNA